MTKEDKPERDVVDSHEPLRIRVFVFLLSLFVCQRSTYIRHEKSRDKRLESHSISTGYSCHFVKLLTSTIYVEGVYAMPLYMSNMRWKSDFYALFGGLFEYFFGVYQVLGGGYLYPLVRKYRFEAYTHRVCGINNRLW